MNEALARYELAKRLADEAGQRTLQFFKSADLVIETKSDGTPVTIFDRQTEDFLRAEIQSAFPEDAILGEERGETPATPGTPGASTTSEGWRWIVDPIDGTDCFTKADPHFATLIGVEHNGEAMIGAVRAPALNETLHAIRGGGAHYTTPDHEACAAHVTTTSNLREAIVEIADAQWFERRSIASAHAHLIRAIPNTRQWSTGYALIAVAVGQIDACIHTCAGPWDLAAFMTIIEEAGGRLTDLAGRRTFDGPFVLASNGLIHDELVAIAGAGGAHPKGGSQSMMSV